MGYIRTLLAIIVIIGHTEPLFGSVFLGGKISVQAFYIISGFYMSLILCEKYVGVNNSYKLFITNRLIRLYPVYWAVLILILTASLLVAAITGGNHFGPLNVFKENYDILSPLSLIILVISNLFIFFQDTLLFFEIDPATGSFFFQQKFNINALNGLKFSLVPQAWTVALELLFYLIAPFIVRRKTHIIILLFMLFVILKSFLHYGLGLNYAPWNFRFFPSELIFFLMGIISYKIYTNYQWLLSKPNFNKLVFACIIAASLVYDKVTFDYKSQLFFTLFFLSIPFIFKMSGKSKLDRYIGELSYPLYIVHIFVIWVTGNLDFINLYKGIYVIIISVLASIALKHFVSDKIEIYRQNRLK